MLSRPPSLALLSQIDTLLTDTYLKLLKKLSPDDVERLYKSTPNEVEIVLPIYGKIIIPRDASFLLSIPGLQRLQRVLQLSLTYVFFFPRCYPYKG